MLFTLSEAAREACLRLHEILAAIEDEELSTIEGPDDETLVDADDLTSLLQTRLAASAADAEEDEEEEEAD